MALPKEPRQKMINMMYLVLTALLALNVSAEIINAFKVVDNSLRQSNNVLTSSTQAIYDNFNEMLKDPKTAEKAAIWKPKADKARELSKQASDLIDKYKMQLMKEADYDPSQGDSSFKEDNIDVATRVFDTQGEGKNLYAALENYKKGILAIDPEIAKALGNKIPLDLSIPKSTTGKKPTGDAVKDWVTSNFYMTPTVAALTMLSKFQNDVKNTENEVATYCANQVGSVKIIYDKFVPLVSTNSSYFMPGEEMEIQAGLGAFNASVKPQVTIDGKAITVNEQGVAETKFNVGGTGSRKMRVNVKYVDPSSGEMRETTKDIEYTVGAPSGVAVSADKMNVLYIGVDNPLTITAGAGSEKVTAAFSGGSISKASGSKYIARPSAGSSGEHTVTVLVEGKAAGKVMFRVKQLPNPAAYVGNLKPGAVPSASFKAMGGVIAKLEDSEFDAPFEVVSYKVGAVAPDMPDFNQSENSGARWTGGAATLIGKLKPGALVAITDIRVKGPDGKVRTLNGSLSYILK
ncbi:MAG: gliding motility protein GldM [Chitinophagaceae bacterium]|jgi:gliding motility-associated protein GldM|nr:gliding motility protein GldM [Chitinophagaceae bacterium]